MRTADLPANEHARLAKLRQYRVLDTPPEEAFDAITRVAAEALGVPIALVSLVDEDRQWFKACHGLPATETSRDISFCAHAILDDEVTVVADATSDPRFADNPLVIGPPFVRFYVGAPLNTADGFRLGTLCVLDTVPREVSDAEKTLLRDLARLAIDALELRSAIQSSMTTGAPEIEATAMRDEFLATVSHELRTPLASLRGALGLLAGGAYGALNDEILEPIRVAERNSRRLLRLVDDLLDLRSVETDTLSFDFAVIDGATLVREACEDMRGQAQAAGVTIRIDDVDSASVFGDVGRLGQVLSNVLSNAIKYSPHGGEVVVSAGASADRLRISISDHGCGIPKELQSAIFRRFFRVPDQQIPGTGLGLAVAAAILDAHHGRISVRSEVGAGATFRIDLPLRRSLLERRRRLRDR